MQMRQGWAGRLLLFAAIMLATSGRAAGPIGRVEALDGSASATGAKGEGRGLREGAPVFLNDVIKTGRASKIQILFDDDSVISQGESAELRIDKYVYTPRDKTQVNCALSMLKGVFRVTTGKITDMNPERFRVRTRLSTVGIRGCTIGFRCGKDRDRVYVIGLPKGKTISIHGLRGERKGVRVSQPGIVVDVDSEGKPEWGRFSPDEAGRLSSETVPEDVQQREAGEQGEGADTAGEDSDGKKEDGGDDTATGESAPGDDTAAGESAPGDGTAGESTQESPAAGDAGTPAEAGAGDALPGTAGAVPDGQATQPRETAAAAPAPESAAPDSFVPMTMPALPSPVPPMPKPIDQSALASGAGTTDTSGGGDGGPAPAGEVIATGGGSSGGSSGGVVSGGKTAFSGARSGADWWGRWSTDGLVASVSVAGSAVPNFAAIKDGSVLYNLSGSGFSAATIQHNARSSLVAGSCGLNVQVGRSFQPAWDGTFSLNNADGDSLSFDAAGSVADDGSLSGSSMGYSLKVDGVSLSNISSEQIGGKVVGPGTGDRPVTGAYGNYHFEHGGAATVDGVFAADLN